MQVTTRLDGERSYRLLQLTPALEQALRAGELTLRSDGAAVFACTRDSTHLLRRLKQSNTLMLTRAHADGLQAFAAPTELLETVEAPAVVDWARFPVYAGARAALPPAAAVEPPVSAGEFARLRRAKPVVELGGAPYVVAPDVVHDVLVDVVSAMVERGDFDLGTALSDLALQTAEPPEVVRAVHSMFAAADAPHALDKAAIARWTGAYVLRQHPQGMPVHEFAREWERDLPVKLDTRLATLAEAVETRPGVVRFVDASRLAPEPRARFAELFRLKAAWLLTEIEPFVRELVPPTQKLDTWVLKHARKTRQGADFVITARKL